MKKLFTHLAAFLFTLLISLQVQASNSYHSTNPSGLIGTNEEHPIDNPVDNVFHIRIDEQLNATDRVWLTYELAGVSDHLGVSHSVNDQLAQGGYLVSKRHGFALQKEVLAANWLVQGDNIIRFTLPAGAKYSYRVRNLSIEVEKGAMGLRELVVNESVKAGHFGKYAYVKGFITGLDAANAQVFIDGERVSHTNGAFEMVLESETEKDQWDILVEAVYPDGERFEKKVVLDRRQFLDLQYQPETPNLGVYQLFSPTEASTLTCQGAQLTFPAGALQGPMMISATALRDVDVPTLDPNMVNVTAGNHGFRFLPHVDSFYKDIQVTLAYDPAKIPAGYTEKDIKTYFFDEETHHWVPLPFDSVDAKTLQVHSRTNHFTDMINGIIKVPESPEGDAFNPTSLKDIKAANPSASINMIEPPTANNMGNANLGYPIFLPPGRNGIQPQLSIGYNSGGGNGWLGLGWSMQIPSIMIETRWGVPRYNPTLETETYLLNGQQLTPLAHRDVPIARTPNKQFYPRVEGSFSRVIRHGTNPTNYWWEVTDKSGVRYFYGGTPATGLDNSAVLKDDAGNVAHWCLKEIRDLNENFCSYEYLTVTDFGTIGGTVPGKQIYINRITYTGHGNQPGLFEVLFTRDSQLGEPRRRDVQINARSGFKEVTAELLRGIQVKFDGDQVRRYDLAYEEGAFFKSLLSQIQEFDAADSLFTEHEFDYFDDVRNGNTYIPFEPAAGWNPGSDGIKKNFIAPLSGFDGDATVLSGNESDTRTFGFGVSIGFNDFLLFCKSLTVGGNFSYTRSESEGLIYMVDINGDALPDKVMVGGSGFSYRANQSGPDGTTVFGPVRPITGINEFYKEKSTTSSKGFELHGGCFSASAFVGVNSSKTTSTTSIYYTDVNGDQLIDIAVNGQVFFNRLDGNGNPQFFPNSGGTPNPIFAGDPIAGNIFAVDSLEREQDIDDNPLHDVVRMWEAPYNGSVSITAPVRLIQDFSPERATAPADGVRLAIQLRGTEIWSTVIGENDYSVKIPTNVSNLIVFKGDRIYFRVQSIENGEYDKVEWDPQITYGTTSTTTIDANGRDIYDFVASEDFLLSADQVAGAPIDGTVRLSGTFVKPITSDSVRLLIYEEVSNTIYMERNYSWDTQVSLNFDTTFNVSSGMQFHFQVLTTTNVDWSSLSLESHYRYTASFDPDYPTVVTPTGAPMIEYFPSTYYSVFAEPFTATRTWKAPADGILKVAPILNFANMPSGKVMFSVKQQNKLIGKKNIPITSGSISGDSLITIPVESQEEYYIEYHSTSPELAESYLNSQIDLKFIMIDTLEPPGYGVIESWTAPIGGTIYLSPQINVNGNPTGGIFRIASIASSTTIDTVSVLLGNVEDDTLALPIGTNQQLTFSYAGGVGITQSQISNLDAGVLFIHRDTIEGAFHPLVVDPLFGPFYRQWGLFGYNGNRTRANAPIDETELVMDTTLVNNANITLTDTTAADLIASYQAQGGYDPSTSIFVNMYPNSVEGYWQGWDDLHYITDSDMSSSRMGLDDLTQSSPLPDCTIVLNTGIGSGAYAIRKVTKSRSTSFSAGGGLGGGSFGLSGSYSRTNSETKVISDFLDMNGDRHPDIVTSGVIQYTNPYGGLSSQALSHGNGANHRSSAESEGVTLGGTYVGVVSKGGTTNIDGQMVHHADTRGSLGISGNHGETEDETGVTYTDMNGDGLPDRAVQAGGEIYVSLNLGYKFAPQERWDVGRLGEGESEAYGGGLGINIGNHSIGAGIGLSRSDNESKKSLQDINGDGLSDYLVETGSGVFANLNTGNGFGPTIPWSGANDISQSSSASESVNFTITFSIIIPLFPPPLSLKIAFNPSGSFGQGMSTTEQQLSDINGDGYPDYLTSTRDDNLTVKTSTIQRTNLLKEVKRPMGGSFTLDYEREGNSYDMPNSVWTLSEVDMYDGFPGDGADHIKTAFVYEDGFYDRREREFYGFERVRIRRLDTEANDALYTQTTMEFKNRNFYEKGLTVNETMADAAGNKYVEKRFTYQPQDVLTGNPLLQGALQSTTLAIFPSLKETEDLFYEGQPTPGKNTSMAYEYDIYGNTVRYIDYGDISPSDDLNAEISYHNYQGPYLVGIPSEIVVTNGNTTFRSRQSIIDPVTGNLTGIRQYLQNGDVAEYDMSYDPYGNLTTITRPENANGQRFSLDYQYDNDVYTYVTEVANSYGYSSTATYDYRYGQMLERVDLNGNTIENTLDNVGRITTITGPFEAGTGNYTLRFEYHPDATVPWALTEHYDPTAPTNTIQTSTFMDGMGRALQVKKDIALFQGDGVSDQEAMQVSGRIIFDAFGRTTESYYPVTEPLGTAGTFNPTFDTEQPTTSDYDVLNRVVLLTLPDSAQTATTYDFGNDRANQQQFSTLVTDANGIKTEQFKDVRGRMTAMKNHTSFGDVWTSFGYNAINEKISSTDDLGYSTTFEYDWFGRMVERVHPDQGKTTYEYDLASNLSKMQTAVLSASSGQFIEYGYDFERLKTISYPEYPDNNVEYFYGPAGAPHNRAGRVMIQQDATGAQEFFYGPLGEVVKNIRTVVVPLHGDHTFVTEWTYDTWNRVQEMVYPDGEVLTYTYNAGGLLNTMFGEKDSTVYNYVDQLGYDKFEDRVFLAYANGTKTDYTYEADRRRLKTMTAKTGLGREMMDNVYNYDKTRNILSVQNNAPVPTNNLMGGPSDCSYQYDDLYRLVEAEGTHTGSSHEHRYTLEMTYNSVGSILQKVQDHDRRANSNGNWGDQHRSSHNLQYTYNPNSLPHAPINVDDRTFKYDENGNQLGWDHDVNGTRRNIVWDEENRMRTLYDNGTTHLYTYDADNIRVLKGQGRGQLVSRDGLVNSGSVGIGNYTIYVNPYTVLRSGGYTKHFYIESARIVSKLGDSNGLGITNFQAGQDSVDYAALYGVAQQGVVRNFNGNGGGNGNGNGGNSGNGTGNPANGNGNGGNSGNVVVGPMNGNGNGNNNQGGGNGNGNGGVGNGNGNGNGTGSTNPGEFFQFFYHPDHLGSSAYITDLSGEVYQHLEYFPFGETFVEEHSNTWRTPYLYNGKELDEETQLYYYGARYYDPLTAVWASVDPLADKFAGWSPYNYTMDNPINLIDPDGEKPTAMEAAYMAVHVYEGKGKLTGGWVPSSRSIEGVTFVDDKTGFKSGLYQRKIDGKIEYAYVTAGTDGADKLDWQNNVDQLSGKSDQYRQSTENAVALRLGLGKDELTHVGHSLGGGLASANALKTGDDAITFNPSALSDATRSNLGLGKSATIDAIIVEGEILNWGQRGVGMSTEGTPHYLPANYFPSIPGTRVDDAFRLGQRGYNHMMDAVLERKEYLENMDLNK